jgi:DNA-directed RNA polymerase alpha subunit
VLFKLITVRIQLKLLRLNANKEGPVTAGDIEKDADIEIINPDLVICNLVKGGKIRHGNDCW